MILTAVIGLVALPFLALAMFSVFSPTPKSLGVTAGRLADCPDSPNCVSTEAQDDGHRIEPVRFEGGVDEAVDRLKSILGTMPRTKLVTVDGGYLHAEFTSAVFRYVDDVEFFVDPIAQAIQMRSASRAGHSDLGVNRKRIETIRRAFADAGA